MAVVLKVARHGQLLCVPLDQKKLSYAAIADVLSSLWPDLQAGSAKYADPEGDLCTLVESTFEDFMVTSGSEGEAREPVILKLVVPDEGAAQPQKQPAVGPPLGQGAAHSEAASRASSHSARARCGGSTGGYEKACWEEDERDLEDLLRELGEENSTDPDVAAASRAKRKRQKAKKKEARAATNKQGDEPIGGARIAALAEAASQAAGSKKVHEVTEDVQQDVPVDLGQISPRSEDSDAEFSGKESGLVRQDSMGSTQMPNEDEGEDAVKKGGERHLGVTQDACKDQLGAAEVSELEPPLELVRASSCPCPNTWRPLTASWGDDEDEEEPEKEGLAALLWPATPESTPPASPRSAAVGPADFDEHMPGQPVVWFQVPVWVPVLPMMVTC